LGCALLNPKLNKCPLPSLYYLYFDPINPIIVDVGFQQSSSQDRISTGAVHTGLKTRRVRVCLRLLKTANGEPKQRNQCCRQTKVKPEQTKTDKRALKQRFLQEKSRSQVQPPNMRSATNTGKEVKQ